MVMPARASPRAGRYTAARSWTFPMRESTAAGTCPAAERMASFTPGMMTHMATVSTPMTARMAKISARGRRSRSICRSFGKTWRSMARMGTFSTKAMAPPRRKGASTPTRAIRAPQRAPRCWTAA